MFVDRSVVVMVPWYGCALYPLNDGIILMTDEPTRPIDMLAFLLSLLLFSLLFGFPSVLSFRFVSLLFCALDSAISCTGRLPELDHCISLKVPVCIVQLNN